MFRKPKNRLKVLRAEVGISQLDLALSAGMPRDRYWHIENGYAAPTAADASAIARVLKVEVADIGFERIAHDDEFRRRSA